MQIEPEQRLVSPGQRLVPAVPSSDGSARIVLLFAGAITLALLGFTFHDRATRAFYALEEASGIAPSQQQFAATYRQLGISALPARLFAGDRVASSLTRLAHEACDHQAIGSLASAFASGGEQRLAASALMGFSLSCHGSENEQAAAGQLFLQLGDAEKALAVANALTSAKPEIANFHYFRGKALVAVGRGAEAVNEYKSTIDLSPSPRQVGEWVFLELANLYAALERPCDAAQTIMNWVAIDPTTRNTAHAHKLVETYAARGCAVAPKPDSSSL
jgi:tetratricopeptide (TPR) repeat protein